MENINIEEKKHWYTLKVPSGAEDRIIEQLRNNYKEAGMELRKEDIYSPATIKKIGKKEKKQTLCKGYIFIKTTLNEKITNLITSIAKVSFLYSIPGKPARISDKEYNSMKDNILKVCQSDIAGKTFIKGDTVKIKAGSFNDFHGTIDSLTVTGGIKKATVSVSVFGRESLVTVNFEDIEKI